MWFLAIVAGVVIVIMAVFLARYARRADHPALRSFAKSVPLPVLGASIFVALGLAHHDAALTLAWVVLAYTAGIKAISVAGRLAERARRAGHPALGSFTESAGYPIFGTFLWVALELARRGLDWVNLTMYPLSFAVWAVMGTLRRRRNNAQARTPTC